MYPFSKSVTPAIRAHLDAQAAFFNDITKSLSRSFQQMCELNIQLAQTLLEESHIAGQQLLTVDHPSDAISVAASRAQPASEKLRAYQQHLSKVAAGAQVELSRVAEQHVQTTARTARALADEVARTASEETERSIHQTQETIKNFRDPFEFSSARGGISHAAPGNLQSGDGGSSSGRADVDTPAGHATFQGNAQGGASQQSSGKAGKAS